MMLSFTSLVLLGSLQLATGMVGRVPPPGLWLAHEATTTVTWPTCLGTAPAAALRDLQGAPEPPPATCPFDPATVWLETGDGFVNHFAVAGPLRDAKRKLPPSAITVLAEKLGTPTIFQERAFAAPFVVLAPESDKKSAGTTWLLAARVHSPTKREAFLKASVNSKVAIAFGGKIVLEENGDQYLLPDHRTVPIELEAGWNDLVIRVEQVSGYAAAFGVRLRGRDGRPLSELAWDLPRELLAPAAPAAPTAIPDAPGATGPDLCPALGARITPRVDAEVGWRIEASLDAHGLVPFALASRWALTRDRVPLALADAALAPAQLAVQTQSLTAALPADASDAEVQLSVGGRVCARLAHKTRADARARLLAAEDRIEGLSEKTLGPDGRDSLRYLAQDVRQMLEGDPAETRVERRLAPALAYLEQHIEAARADKNPFLTPGVHIRAYRSPLDGTLRRYLVVVPASYANRKDPVPLIFLSHGLNYTPEDMIRIALGKPSGAREVWASGLIYKWDPPPTPKGAILVADDGFGNAGQRPQGELDVFESIARTRQAYDIDPQRISITGFSLGGSVAFWAAFHAPDLFSAAAPLCGYPNLTEYNSVVSAKKRPFDSILLADEGVVGYAESGRYLPLRMVHGTQDNPRRSEMIADRYKTLRYPFDLDKPALGHNVWDYAFEDGKLLTWLAARKRPKVAVEPSLRTGRYRWSTNYWLRIDRFADEDLFGQLDGKLKGERLSVTTRNVAALTLLPGPLGARADKPLTIVVDNKTIGTQMIVDALHLSREGGAWHVVDAIDRPADGKRPGVEGPIQDIWFDRFIVVYGTQDAGQREANRLTAQRWKRHSPWIEIDMPVKADSEVTPDDLKGRSLVLIGNPASNLVTRQMEKDLAAAGITFEPHALVFGERRFEGDQIGLSTARPSPFDPDHMVVLHAGVGAEGTLSARYLPDFVPDYVIYDDGMRAAYGDRILGARQILAGGFYDARWRIRPEGPAPDTARAKGDERKRKRDPK